MQPSQNSNPAHLIRQARKSMPMAEEETRILAPRQRRTSAPAGYGAPTTEEQACSHGEVKAFKAKTKTAVRTAPSAVGMKIRDLEDGWKVIASSEETNCAGWIPIEPRGYVAADDLVPSSPPREAAATRSARRSAPEAPRSTHEKTAVASTAPRNARQSPRGVGNSPRKAPTAAPRKISGGMQARTSPRQALAKKGTSPVNTSVNTSMNTPSPQEIKVFALKEEEVNLRERILTLREQELERRRQLEELERARMEKDSEQQELEKQQDVMRVKLERCRDAIAFAVGSVDEIYAQQDKDVSVRMSISTATGHGNSSITDSDSHIFPEDLQNAKALAHEADAEVSELLNTLEDNADQENTSAAQAQIQQIASKKTEEMAGQAPRSERTPLGACNSVV